MIHFHNWGKWEAFKRDMIKVNKATGKIIPGTEWVDNWQKRKCKICGKEQWERLD